MRKKDMLALLFFILLCEAAGIAGSFFTASAISEWYMHLIQPDFAPPNWVFAPVWTALYAAMGSAAYLVWRSIPRRGEKAEDALKPFWIQLALNAMWTPVFFGAKDLAMGFVVIVLLWIAIVWTIVRFRRISSAAAWLMVPYLAWVSFATLLNYQLWLLNA